MNRLVAAVAGLIACATLSAPLPAYADGDLSVSWPDAAFVNPDVGDYVITVSDSGPGELIARWQWGSQPIPHDGSAVLELPTDGQGKVEIWRCDSGTCVATGASSPTIEVHRGIDYRDPSVLVGRAQAPGSWQIEAAHGFAGLADVTHDWTLRTPDEELVGSGSVSAGGQPTFDVPAPAGLTEGTYLLDIDVRGTFAGAPITSFSTQTVPVEVDLTPPTIDTVTLWSSWLLPDDERFGSIVMSASADEWASFTVDVLADGGTVLGPADEIIQSESHWSMDAWWNGRVGGLVMDPGHYRFRVTATDQAGNASVALSDPFLLEHARRRVVTRRVTARAAGVVEAVTVGRCSALVEPSSRGWKGSLGLYSSETCAGADQGADQVDVQGRWWLPLSSPMRDYRRIRLEVFGGMARGGPRDSTLVVGFLNRAGEPARRTRCSASVGWHGARHLTENLERWVRYDHGRPFLRWTMAASASTRYDVRGIRLTVRGMAFVRPDGSIAVPPA